MTRQFWDEEFGVVRFPPVVVTMEIYQDLPERLRGKVFAPPRPLPEKDA